MGYIIVAVFFILCIATMAILPKSIRFGLLFIFVGIATLGTAFSISHFTGIPWPITIFAGFFVAQTPLAVVGLAYCMSEIWGWPWWAIVVVITLQFEYWAIKYGKPITNSSSLEGKSSTE
jgi:hypothetical protein